MSFTAGGAETAARQASTILDSEVPCCFANRLSQAITDASTFSVDLDIAYSL
jgi:hypothetical protein